jgi:hypothetical protein
MVALRGRLVSTAGARTAVSERGIPQVREQVRHLLSQVSRLHFGDAVLKFKRKDSCNEGGVTFTPPDDSFRLGGVTRREGGLTLGRGGPWEDWGYLHSLRGRRQ